MNYHVIRIIGNLIKLQCIVDHWRGHFVQVLNMHLILDLFLTLRYYFKAKLEIPSQYYFGNMSVLLFIVNSEVLLSENIIKPWHSFQNYYFLAYLFTLFPFAISLSLYIFPFFLSLFSIEILKSFCKKNY